MENSCTLVSSFNRCLSVCPVGSCIFLNQFKVFQRTECVLECNDDVRMKRAKRHMLFNIPMGFAWRQKATGAAAVELALVLPLSLLVIDGLMELSILMYDKTIVLNAAREAVRYGLVLSSPKKSNADIVLVAERYARQYLVSFHNHGGLHVVVNQSADSSNQTPLSVTVSYTYNSMLAGSFLAAIKQPIILSETVTLMNE